MRCAGDNHNNMCHKFMQRVFLDLNLIKRLLTKYQFFTKLPKILHDHKSLNFGTKKGKEREKPTSSTL